MRTPTTLGLIALLINNASCMASAEGPREDTDEMCDFLAISNKDKLSAASKRAIARYYDQGPEWFCEFRQHNLKGDLKYEPGVIRRDPSAPPVPCAAASGRRDRSRVPSRRAA